MPLSSIPIADRWGDPRNMLAEDHGGAGTGPYSFVHARPRAVAIQRVTTSGTVATGACAVRFRNVHGSGSATVTGVVLKPGEEIELPLLNSFDTYGSIGYDATGSELLITRIA